MSVEQRIDDLIEAGWFVLDSDFDPVAFQHWRRRAFDCLTAVVGPDHVYTRQFENFVRQGRRNNLLAAGGIPSAPREQEFCNRLGSVKATAQHVNMEQGQRAHSSELQTKTKGGA